jgi:hypothetical protein
MFTKAGVSKLDLLFNWRNGSSEHIEKTTIIEEDFVQKDFSNRSPVSKLIANLMDRTSNQ